MISVDEAQARLVAAATPLKDTEYLALGAAYKRILARDYTASLAVPPKANSAMDGYALNVASRAEPGLRLPVSQTVAAGDSPSPLAAGTAARIMTGAILPPGANAVAIQENCTATRDSIVINSAVAEGDNIRPAGQDIALDSLVAQRGAVLGPAALGVIASVGISEVEVVRRPKVAIINTGNELVEPGQPLQSGQIYNSNRFVLQALLTELGCQVQMFDCVDDTLAATVDALTQASADNDLVISSGGVSVGDEDYIKTALAQMGRLDLWKIRLKPGKPLAFGYIDHNQKVTPLLGLPGNPVSAYVTFLLFAKPFLAALQGVPWQTPDALWLPADFSTAKASARSEYIRVRVVEGRLQRFDNQSSGVLRSLQWADGLALLPTDTIIKPGDPMAFFPLSRLLSIT